MGLPVQHFHCQPASRKGCNQVYVGSFVAHAPCLRLSQNMLPVCTTLYTSYSAAQPECAALRLLCGLDCRGQTDLVRSVASYARAMYFTGDLGVPHAK